MKGFWNILRHKYFHFAAAIMIVFLPLVLFINNQEQDQRGEAESSTSVYFTPSSSASFPIQKKVGDNFSLDMMLNPGSNLVSIIKVDISYDPSKVKLSSTNPMVINETIFPQIVEGPVYSSGRVQVALSVGSDLTKAISSESRALTLNFIAQGAINQTVVSFGSNTEVYSVAATDQSGENVLSTTTPSYIKISKNTGKSGGGKGKPSK